MRGFRRFGGTASAHARGARRTVVDAVIVVRSRLAGPTITIGAYRIGYFDRQIGSGSLTVNSRCPLIVAA